MRTVHDPAYVRLASALHARRLALGLTQEDIARKLGVSRTFIVRTEQRERRLDILETYKLLRVLKMRLAAVERLLAGGKRP